MADTKLSALPALGAAPATDDLIYIDDVSAGASKSMTVANLFTSPTLVTPALGTPASGVATNLTGTAAGLTAGTVTTNANLTGHVTSVGNAAVLGSFTSAQLKAALTDETGSGAAVFADTPTLVAPILGTPTSGVLTNCTGTASGLTAGNVTTNANLTGDVTSVGNATTIAPLDGTPNTDHTSNGPKTSTFAAGESVTVMDLVYLKSDGEWWKTDSDAAATSAGLLAISLESKTDGQAMSVALPGSFVRDDTWNWTVGDVLYIDATPGAITATQPSGTDDVIRVIGYAVTADVIYFYPEAGYITHT